MTFSFDSLAALADIVGAIAVVLSLVYVGYQIKQNTKAIRSQVHESLVGHVFESEGSLLGNADLAQIIVKSNSNPDSLTPEEQLRAEKYFTFMFVNWEAAFLHHKQGFIEDEMWRRWDLSLHPDKESKGHIDFWQRHRHWYDSSFVHHVDQVFRDLGIATTSSDDLRGTETE